MGRSDEALELAREILTLEARLAEKRREWASLFGDDQSTASAVDPEPPLHQPRVRVRQEERPGAFLPAGATKEGSIADRIRNHLVTAGGRAVPLTEITSALDDVDPRRVWGATARLARNSASGVRKIKRGQYRYVGTNGATSVHAVNTPNRGGSTEE